MFRHLLFTGIGALAILAELGIPAQVHAQRFRMRPPVMMATPGFRAGVMPGFRAGVQPGFRSGFAPGFRNGFRPGFTPGFRGAFSPAFGRTFLDRGALGGMFAPRLNGGMFNGNGMFQGTTSPMSPAMNGRMMMFNNNGAMFMANP